MPTRLPPDAEHAVGTQVVFPSTLLRRLDERCDQERRPRSHVVRDAVAAYLSRPADAAGEQPAAAPQGGRR